MIISKYIKDYLCKYLNLRCLRHGPNMLLHLLVQDINAELKKRGEKLFFSFPEN